MSDFVDNLRLERDRARKISAVRLAVIKEDMQHVRNNQGGLAKNNTPDWVIDDIPFEISRATREIRYSASSGSDETVVKWVVGTEHVFHKEGHAGQSDIGKRVGSLMLVNAVEHYLVDLGLVTTFEPELEYADENFFSVEGITGEVYGLRVSWADQTGPSS